MDFIELNEEGEFSYDANFIVCILFIKYAGSSKYLKSKFKAQ